MSLPFGLKKEITMNLFEEIEGLSGEPLTSALLRLLILRSQEIRDEWALMGFFP